MPDPRMKALQRACQAVSDSIAEFGDAGSLEELKHALSAFDTAKQDPENYQAKVMQWINECFGSDYVAMRSERSHRFLEEALELVQSLGCSETEATQLLSHVYGRPVGEPLQELGGVMVTLAALCGVNQMSMVEGGDKELDRVWSKIDQIRAGQDAKKLIVPQSES